MQIVSKETVIENWPVVKTRYEGRITKAGGGVHGLCIYIHIYLFIVLLSHWGSWVESDICLLRLRRSLLGTCPTSKV